MKLYMVPLAPNPTKVMLYIAERNELGVQMHIDQIVVNTRLKADIRNPSTWLVTPLAPFPPSNWTTGPFSWSP